MIRMKHLIWVLIIPISIVSACSSSKSISKNNKNQANAAASSPWYKKSKSFQVGRTGYSATATSISSDSVRALYKAGQAAMANLRSGMQKQLEDLRIKLVHKDINAADKPAFIWLMRGAIPVKMAKVTKVRSRVVSNNGIYQAYVQLRYLKTDLKSDLLNALSVNSSYAAEVKNAGTFQQWFTSPATDSTHSTM